MKGQEFDMNQDQEELAIYAIELAYGSLHYSEIRMEKAFELSIGHLYEMYGITGEKEYLNNALLHICAYVKMGLSYERQQELFDPILELIDRKSFSRLKIIQNTTMKQVGLTKTQIRGMIGRWMPSASNPKKIGDVVDDIIEKVKVREQGIHTYAYKRGNIEYIYELVISEEQCFFHDVRQRKYYFFEVPEK